MATPVMMPFDRAVAHAIGRTEILLRLALPPHHKRSLGVTREEIAISLRTIRPHETTETRIEEALRRLRRNGLITRDGNEPANSWRLLPAGKKWLDSPDSGA